MIANRFAPHTPHALWIDAICINQDDVKAKEEELPKMADISRGAHSVVCLISGVDVYTCEAVKRGVLHPNNGARKKSRLAQRLKRHEPVRATASESSES